MKKTTIASLISLAFTSHAFAVENINLDDVLVSANRFNEVCSPYAGNLKVITKEEIRKSPALSIPDVLRMQAGLNVTNLYGNQGIDASLDSRGFGDTATSNTLILLDGQRLNGVDSGSIQWASIPLDSIHHIEIISGGGSVLYGDRATGGVINLITDKSGKSAASLTTTVGSYGYKSLDGFVAGGTDNLYFNTFIHTADGNGWRNNTDSNQWAISGRTGAYFNAGEAFVDYSVYRSANGLPGSIRSAVYQNDPRSARTPLDSQVKDGFRIRPGISLRLSDNIEVAAELAIAQSDQHFDNINFSSTLDRALDTYSLTPRVKWSHGLGALSSVTVTGFDYYHGKVNGDSHGAYANQNAKQSSQAIYLQNNTAITSSLDFTAGLRSQQMSQDANQFAYVAHDPIYSTGAISGSAANSKTAYNFGLSYHQSNWGTYAKLDNSFRFANTDELFNYDALIGQSVFSGNIIKPQTANNQEIGAMFQKNSIHGKIAVYHTNIKNEIGFDGAQGINTNFDPTRHQGLELEIGWEILTDIKTKLSYAYTDAEFKSGSYHGKNLPSVPRNIAHAQLLWDGHQNGKYVAQVNYVGQRYTSGDFNNSLDKLPSYTTLDLRGNWNIKPVTISLSMLNVTDKKYSPYALYAYDPATNYTKQDYFYYPADGRTLYLSARYDFK